MRSSILDYLLENADNDDEVAFRHRPKLRVKSWTYAKLARTAFQFACELEERNIGTRDRVVIWAENSPEWIAAFWGIVLRGSIAVPLDEQSTSEFVLRACEKTEPKLILAGDGVDCSPLIIPYIELKELSKLVQRHSSRSLKPEETKLDDTVEIVFTSGTTAEPKGVVITHGNLLANLEPIEGEIKKYLKWKFIVDPLTMVCALPLSHVFGQTTAVFIPQILRTTVVFQNKLSPSELIETVKRDRAMVLAAVPRVLESLKRKIETDLEQRWGSDELRISMEKPRSWLTSWWRYRHAHQIFGWKFICFVTGGATLDEPIEKFWRKLGYAVVQGYGMTETAALVSLNNPFSTTRGSLGQVLAGSDNIRLNKNGEILVRGKNVSPGYWGESHRKSEEWLNTGDIGTLDNNGQLYFKGRKKDVIVTAAGMNIYPSDIEAALNSQPEVIHSAVVGIDVGNGPEAAAALILRAASNADTVVARANQKLAEFQQIRHWYEWPDADLPRTSTQKVRKNIIAKTISSRLTSGVPDGSSENSLLAGILSRFAGASNPTEPLILDSLSRVELLSAIEDKYQIDIDEAAFTSTSTIGEIEDLIKNEIPAATRSTKFAYPRWPTRFPVSWIRPAFYELVIYPITRLLASVNKRGVEHLSSVKGPVIFASNHITYIDPALIISAMPRRFRSRLAIAMDGERLRAYVHPPAGTSLIKRVRWFFTYWLVITFFNAFPLPRFAGFRESFSFAGEAMDRGYNILIFPEGELTKEGELQKLKSGIGPLTNGLEAPIIPVAINGLYELRRERKRGYAKPGSVTISFGQPIPFDGRKSADEITQELESRIREIYIPAP